MNKLMVVIISFCMIPCTRANEIPCPQGMDMSEYMLLSTEGGYTYRDKSGYGTFLFLNKQKRIPLSDLEGKVRMLIEDENWVRLCFSSEKQQAEIVTEIVDIPNNSTLAIYPEEKRAIVNIFALSKDNPCKDVLASRTRKEMLRAFSYLAGITGGGTPGRILDVMSDMARLDASVEEIPGELVIRNQEFLKRSGVKPYERVTYRQACEEGWAHNPTNVWEQAIWNEVHAMPTKPLTIKRESERGK